MPPVTATPRLLGTNGGEEHEEEEDGQTEADTKDCEGGHAAR